MNQPLKFLAAWAPRCGWWAPCLLLAGIAGCSTAPTRPLDPPSVALPARFRLAPVVADPAPAEAAMPTDGASPAPILDDRALREWWRLLGDPELDALVDRALANNPELHIANARIVQGWARAHQVHAAAFPTLDLSYQAIAQRPNGTSVGELTTSGSASYHVVQLSSSLHVDLWGERDALTESAVLQFWQRNFLREDTRRLVVANLVALYVDYLSLNDRIRIARDTEQVLHGMLDSVKGRMEGGDATATDYEQQRAAVHAVAATIPVLELQRETTLNAVAMLLGVAPSAVVLPVDRGLAALTVPSALPSMPPQLLLNRPDVRAAEYRLQAAKADIDVARARLLPGLDLTAQAGYGAQWLSQLISPSSFYWSAIAGLSASLFDHGARTDEVEVAQAVQEELVETYVRTLYGAIRDTEDALATVRYQGSRRIDQAIASEAAHAAWQHSTEAYAAGAIDYLTLLETQRSYFNNLDLLQQVERDRLKGVVALYSALGGGAAVGTDGPDSAPVASDSVRIDLSDTPLASSPLLAGMSLSLASAASAPERGQDGDWAVEVAGLQDADGVQRLARDLGSRFAEALAGHPLVARQAQQPGGPHPAPAASFRVYVTGFSRRDEADALATVLAAQLQRVRTVSTREAGYREGARRVVPLSALPE